MRLGEIGSGLEKIITLLFEALSESLLKVYQSKIFSIQQFIEYVQSGANHHQRKQSSCHPHKPAQATNLTGVFFETLKRFENYGPSNKIMRPLNFMGKTALRKFDSNFW